MDISPFPFQGPLDPDQVRGRAELIGDLTARLTERRVTALIGPRRYGKTSALRRVAADITDGGAHVVWVDLYEVASMADLAARLDDALAAVRGPLRRRLDTTAATMKFQLGVAQIELSRPAPQRPDPLGMVHVLLNLLVQAALREPTVVIFDEFSSIVHAGNGAGLMRTYLQHHYQKIGLMFAGSEPSMMTMLFTDYAQPFYAQADLVEIGPLTPSDVLEIVNGGFEATGRDAGSLGAQIGNFAGGHPQRVMQLADAAWRLVAPGGTADADTWRLAVDTVRRDSANGHERLFSGMTESEKAVLRILSSGGSIFGTKADVLDLANGSAQHARRSLVDRGHLHQVDGRYVPVDPLFADWVANRFPF